MKQTGAQTEALEAARKDAELTQEAVASLLGISRSTYWRRIAGISEFTATEAKAIRRHLGVDLLA